MVDGTDVVILRAAASWHREEVEPDEILDDEDYASFTILVKVDDKVYNIDLMNKVLDYACDTAFIEWQDRSVAEILTTFEVRGVQYHFKDADYTRVEYSGSVKDLYDYIMEHAEEWLMQQVL